VAVELLTYEDCVNHLADVFDAVLSNTVKLGRLARIAVDSVYRDFPYRYNWRYYQRRATFETVASYSTGTIEYDHTGGSSERLVTLTTGTLPSWTKFGRIIIDDVAYRIATNPSSTTLTLYEEDNPGDDVAAGTTYTLYRSEYPFPADFRRNIRLYDTTDEIEIPLVLFGESQRLQVGVDKTPDTPRRAYIRNTGDYMGVWSIEFMPPPSAARTYDLSYEAKPRDILTVSYSTGTVSTSGTTATFSSSGLPASVLPGAVVRFSADATAVTNKFGSNPFIEQRILVAKTSATVWTLDQALTTDATSDAYSVSDPIDVHPGAMTTAFLRAIEAEFAKLLNAKDLAERMAVADRTRFQAYENEPSDTYANAVFGYEPEQTWTTEA
jgi:hypothetical protein